MFSVTVREPGNRTIIYSGITSIQTTDKRGIGFVIKDIDSYCTYVSVAKAIDIKIELEEVSDRDKMGYL